MTTRNLVPRADGEGSLGTAAKQWGAMRAKNIYIDGVDVTEAVTETAEKAAAAATSAANAANSASSASTTATQLMTYLEDKEEITAPAVDPTLTISGAAADAKVTGDAITGLATEINGATFFILNPYMLEKGYYDNDGVKQSHSSRWRTKELRPMHQGDILFTVPFTKNSNYPSIKIEVFNEQKTHTETTGWSASFNTYVLGYTFEQDGYFALSMQVANTTTTADDFSGKVTYTRQYINHDEIVRYANVFDKFGFKPVNGIFLENGYWSYSLGSLSKIYSSIRVSNISPIFLNQGDEVHPTSKDVLFDVGNDTSLRTAYLNIPYIAPYDGNVYFNFKNSSNSAVEPNDFSNALIVRRKSNLGTTEIVSNGGLVNGYFDETDNYAIHNHSARVVGFDGIKANKGDHVRINSTSLAVRFYEFSKTGTHLTHSTSYMSKNYVHPQYICGDYIVQNDECWVMAQMYLMADSQAAITPSDCYGAYEVIHMAQDTEKLSIGKYRFPLSPKKPRIINENSYVEMQDGTIINGKLWVMCDDYVNNKTLKIINLQTGLTEKTITTDFSHGNAIDYNSNNDTLLICDQQNIYLYPNPTGEEITITVSDCTVVSVNRDDAIIGTACWGEDNQTLYVAIGYDSTTSSVLNIVTKIILGMTSGTYTGTYTVDKVYSIDVKDGVDTVVHQTNVDYTQGAEYDGYLYVGYGTAGHNFLVLDLDDNTGIANVVGNYMYHWYNEDRTENILEPQIVALNNDKIVLGSRNWNDSTSLILEFER